MSDDKNMNDLQQRIRDAQTARHNTDQKAQADKDAENKRVGMQAGMELVGAIAAGFLLGLGLDTWLNTKPLFIISLLLIGMVVGFYNVYRLTNGHGTAVGFGHLHQDKHKGLSVASKDAKTPPENE